MKSLINRFHLFFIVLTMIALVAALQAQMGGGRGQGRMMGGPFYNTGTEVMVNGTVSEVQQIAGQTAAAAGTTWARCPRGWAGTHLLLNTDAGPLIVHVGPSAYLASKNFSIAKDDKVTILGSKVQYQGSDFLIAKQITKGDQVLTLRDSSGFPLWSGFRGGTPMPLPSTGN